MESKKRFSSEQNEEFAEVMFKKVDIVLKFTQKHKDAISGVMERSDFKHRDAMVKGLWYRICLWLQSIKKLNASKDFQTHASANRALFELTVDLALIHRDKSNVSGWKMYWWNESEKLKAAISIISHFKDKKVGLPSEYISYQNFLSTSEQTILRMRSELWGNNKQGIGNHPKHWTGKPSFFDSLEDVDVFLDKSIIELFKMPFVQYYKTEYRKMNWHIHSGASSFWDLPKESFPLATGFFLNSCANFGFLATEIVLKDFGLDEHLPDYISELRTIEETKQKLLLDMTD